ncbi:MAG: hypothetical protein MK076_04310 [Flavobacteriales bacterium]|nr:hypothetical protein [Flavobacteriales bacterium]
MAKTESLDINLIDRIEASNLRDAIIEGYHDLIYGRIYEFSGDLMVDLKSHKVRQS